MLRFTETSRCLPVLRTYGIIWDIKFNPLKSQLLGLTFGGSNPTTCVLSICGNSIPSATKVKYIGVLYFV